MPKVEEILVRQKLMAAYDAACERQGVYLDKSEEEKQAFDNASSDIEFLLTTLNVLITERNQLVDLFLARHNKLGEWLMDVGYIVSEADDGSEEKDVG